MKYSPLIIISLFLLFGCSKYSATNRSYKKQVRKFAKIIRKTPLKDSITTSAQWVGTTNFSMRRPNFVVIHHTAQNSCAKTLETFTTPVSQVSAHYVICKDGTIHHMLNDFLRAWHAGVSRWGNLTDVNSSSIGIEIDNNGFEPFTEQQVNSLLVLLGALKKIHGIPTANFIGHSDVAPVRKVDPNVTFPWQKLAENGFGLWYGDTSKVTLPQNFNHLQALRIIGYDVRDTGAAIEAFKRHFETQDKSRTLSNGDKKILFDLMRKFMNL